MCSAKSAARRAGLMQAFATWLAVYPTITVLSLAGEPFMEHWPLPVRTLVISLTMVPIMLYVLIPFVSLWLRTIAENPDMMRGDTAPDHAHRVSSPHD